MNKGDLCLLESLGDRVETHQDHAGLAKGQVCVELGKVQNKVLRVGTNQRGSSQGKVYATLAADHNRHQRGRPGRNVLHAKAAIARSSSTRHNYGAAGGVIRDQHDRHVRWGRGRNIA